MGGLVGGWIVAWRRAHLVVARAGGSGARTRAGRWCSRHDGGCRAWAGPGARHRGAGLLVAWVCAVPGGGVALPRGVLGRGGALRAIFARVALLRRGASGGHGELAGPPKADECFQSGEDMGQEGFDGGV